MNEPLVSIIMPVYNGEKYIKEAIDSVINQTYKNWELIIVNDGSKDNTEKIIKSYYDKRIKYFCQENRGVSAARNKALELAKGKYVTFLDSDDYLPPNSIKARVEYLEKNPDIDIVDGVVVVKDEKLNKTLRKYIPYYTGKLLPELLKLNDRVFFNVSYMIKKEKIENIKFNENMTHVEDLLFFIETAFKYGLNYSFVEDEVLWYRSGNISAVSNLDGIEKGYYQFLKELQKMNSLNIFYLKLKIAKIMFLSRISQKEYFNAIKSVIKFLKV